MARLDVSGPNALASLGCPQEAGGRGAVATEAEERLAVTLDSIRRVAAAEIGPTAAEIAVQASRDHSGNSVRQGLPDLRLQFILYAKGAPPECPQSLGTLWFDADPRRNRR